MLAQSPDGIEPSCGDQPPAPAAGNDQVEADPGVEPGSLYAIDEVRRYRRECRCGVSASLEGMLSTALKSAVFSCLRRGPAGNRTLTVSL